MDKQVNENTVKKLGIKIKIERQKRKISQEKLAEIANLNRNYIGMIERGETNVSVKNLESIANAFAMHIGEMFNFSI